MIRILILTETFAGYGHYKAAQALKKGLETVIPQIEVKIICTLPLISKKLEAFLGKCYLRILQLTPHIWGTIYQADARYSLQLRQMIKHILKPVLIPIIESVRPHVILCTHALCLSTCAMLKKKMKPSYRLGAVVTDFDIHPYWIESEVDFYLLSHSKIKQKLANQVPADIYDTGIPIDPSFAFTDHHPAEIRKKLGWAPDRLTILITGGGIGLGPLPKIIDTLAPLISQYPIQLVTVSGKNQQLLQQLKHLYHEPHFYHYGFVQTMPEFMTGADLIITKSGGLTCSEALARSLPLLINQPIPGQEEKNSLYLIEEKVAIRQDQVSLLSQEIVRFFESPSLLTYMKKRTQTIAKPYSAFHAAETITQYL